MLNLNHSPTFFTVRESLDTRYFLPLFCGNSMDFPSDEFLNQADTAAVGFVATHWIMASSFGLLSLALIGITVAETSSTRGTIIIYSYTARSL